MKSLEYSLANIPVGLEIYDQIGFMIDINNKDMEIFGVRDKADVLLTYFSITRIYRETRERDAQIMKKSWFSYEIYTFTLKYVEVIMNLLKEKDI